MKYEIDEDGICNLCKDNSYHGDCYCEITEEEEEEGEIKWKKKESTYHIQK